MLQWFEFIRPMMASQRRAHLTLETNPLVIGLLSYLSSDLHKLAIVVLRSAGSVIADRRRFPRSKGIPLSESTTPAFIYKQNLKLLIESNGNSYIDRTCKYRSPTSTLGMI